MTDNDARRELEPWNALGYISSPTMGLPAGKDAAEWCMEGATEEAVRLALRACIWTARKAIYGTLSSPSSTLGGDQK